MSELTPWIEKIHKEEFLYFKGKATFKYRGEYYSPLSEMGRDDFYKHGTYYDVKLKFTSQVNEDEYYRNPKRIILERIADDVILEYSVEKYKIDADCIFLPVFPEIEHNQVFNGELDAYVVDAPVYFKLSRKKEELRCKEGFPTGEHEEQDGMVRREYYRCDCSTYWSPWIKKGLCQSGSWTGQEELREDGLFREYFDENCDTYWEKYACVEGKETGRIERKQGYLRKEYLHRDCSKYWGEWQPDPDKIGPPEGSKPEPPNPEPEKNGDEDGEGPGDRTGDGDHETNGGRNWPPSWWPPKWWPPKWYPNWLQGLGCLQWGLWLYLFYVIYISFEAGSWLPLFGGVLIPLGIYLIYRLLTSINTRFAAGVYRIYSFISWLILGLFILLLLRGIISMFESGAWDWSDDTVWRDDTEFVPEITSDSIPEPTDDLDSFRVSRLIKLRWKDFSNNEFEGTYRAFKDDAEKSSVNLNSISPYSVSSFREIYGNIYRFDRSRMTGLYNMLDSIGKARNLNEYQFAEMAVTMVQHIKYVYVMDGECKRNMNPCDPYNPFGLNTPLEFSYELKGDCDTRTLLLYTLLKRFNYDVAIINSSYYEHSMLGLSLDNGRGSYKSANGKRYYFWETTSSGFRMGQMPPGNSNLYYWEIELI